jgi:hypothetical protein
VSSKQLPVRLTAPELCLESRHSPDFLKNKVWIFPRIER